MAKGRLRNNPAGTVRQDYFQWLCEIVNAGTGSVPYWLLAAELHSLYFQPIVIRNDENRAADGIGLREEYLMNSNFLNQMGAEQLYGYLDNGPCTILEMLVALAKRINFDLEDPDEEVDRTALYFWEMANNLGLTAYPDDAFHECDGQANTRAIVDVLVNRTYQPNGYGGLFPLDMTNQDQRYVEIWNQKNAYLNERY